MSNDKEKFGASGNPADEDPEEVFVRESTNRALIGFFGLLVLVAIVGLALHFNGAERYPTPVFTKQL